MSDGGLQLEWHLRGLNVEVTVPPTGPVEVWYENLANGDELYPDHLWVGDL